MKKQFLNHAAALAVTAASLAAQGGVITSSGFQEANVIGRSGGVIMQAQGGGRGAAQIVNGKPVSATEERKTVQTLADGTQLENATTNLFYRDSQGRTRVEETVQGRTTIRINDPVAHTSIVLDPAAKTARKNNVVAVTARMPLTSGGGGGGVGGGVGGAQLRETAPVAQAGVGAQRKTGAQPTTGGGGGGGGRSPAFEAGNAAGVVQREQLPAPTAEELGVQTVNGVAAQGTRNTIIIPAGRIGNNRDLHVVNERWFSNEIQMLVKSVNTDPRFGTTTYQLTNIQQGEPASTLFQIPADYTVVEPGK